MMMKDMLIDFAYTVEIEDFANQAKSYFSNDVEEARKFWREVNV